MIRGRLPIAKGEDFEGACFDCPAARVHQVAGLVRGGRGHCHFDTVAVADRAPVSVRWQSEGFLALVRRGVLVRERVDAQGQSEPIDVAGPGACLRLGTRHDGELSSSGYAIGDVLLCVMPPEVADGVFERGGRDAVELVHLLDAASVRAERLAALRGTGRASERILRTLRWLAEILPNRDGVPTVPACIQQRDLAAFSRTRHETVCRELKRFERAGLVERTPEGWRLHGE